jgi:hypothetical protein
VDPIRHGRRDLGESRRGRVGAAVVHEAEPPVGSLARERHERVAVEPRGLVEARHHERNPRHVRRTLRDLSRGEHEPRGADP